MGETSHGVQALYEDAVVQLKSVSKAFFRKGRTQAGSFNAVDDVSLQLQAGRVLACMGRSGSGKTTLLNIMAGLLAPSSGTVELQGTNLYALDDARLSRLRNQHVGVVPQGQTPVHSLTLLQNVMLPGSMYGEGEPAGLEDDAMRLLEDLEVSHLADSYPAELSGGELRRMAIARALALKPAVVLADEPTGDLDEASTNLVLESLRRAADGGAAVFMVTHDQEAASAADAICRMDAGRLA